MILQKLKSYGPLVVLLVVVNFLLLHYVNSRYPIVGHDYYYILPRMIDTQLHYLVNGLSVQWYTPSFGGGLPGFPNPISFQFSLNQFLFSIFGLWSAVELTIALTSAMGMVFTYLLLKNRFQVSVWGALLGSLFYGLNGFTLNHFMAGHLTYHLIYFCPLVVYVFSSPQVKPVLLTLVTAATLALALHSAGVQLLVAMSLSISLCISLFSKLGAQLTDRSQRFFWVGIGLFLGAMISAAKMNAALSFMAFFPREIQSSFAPSFWSGLVGLGSQLLGYPFFKCLGFDGATLQKHFESYNGNPFGLWEHDTSLPIFLFVILGLAIACLALFKTGRQDLTNWFRTKWSYKRFWLIGLFLLWLTFEMIFARGVLFSILKTLPILKSLHVNIRFTSAFILPLCLAAGLAFDYLRIKLNWSHVLSSVLVFFVSLLSLWYYSIYQNRPADDPSLMTFDAKNIFAVAQKIADGETFVPVKYVLPAGDDQVAFNRVTNLRPYEPIFGYRLEALKLQLSEGGTSTISDGKYNITNPASLVFPAENGLSLFERISASDSENFNKFINRQQPDWKISTRQKVANFISLVGLLVFAGLFGVGLVRLVIRRRKS